jgi:hypothetical protein
MLEFSLADGLLLLGMPIAAAIVVALIFVLIARTRVDSYLSPTARLRMNDDGSLREVVEHAYEHEHELAA